VAREIPFWIKLAYVIIFSFVFLINIVSKFIPANATALTNIFMVWLGLSILAIIIFAVYTIVKAYKEKWHHSIIALAITGFIAYVTPFVLFSIKYFADKHELTNIICLVLILCPLVYSIILIIPKEKEFKKYSNHVSLDKLFIMYILTLGTYKIWWMIRNWTYIKEGTRKDVYTWDYIGLFVPIVNIFMLYNQFETIKECSKEKLVKVTWSAGWMTFWFLILTAAALPSFKHDNIYTIVIFTVLMLGIIPIVTIQTTMNKLWNKSQRKLPRKLMYTSDYVWAVIGIILWTLEIMLIV